MNHRTGLERNQTLLFPETLADYISPDNPVRFLDAFVGSLDLRALGFARAIPENTGRPPYAPADLLKLYLYGYLHRIRSSRLLEAECHRNVEVIWLLGKLSPDFKTIADFRKDNGKALQAVARQFTRLCKKLELFGGQLVGIDGTKLAALNSKDANYNQKKLQELMGRADAQIAEYLQLLDQADAAEPQSPALTRAELEAKIAALQDKRDWHEELLEQLHNEGDTQVSVNDPQARRMRSGGGGSVVGYNVQAAVDTTNHLIVAHEVTNVGTDKSQLANMANQAKAALEAESLEAFADRGRDEAPDRRPGAHRRSAGRRLRPRRRDRQRNHERRQGHRWVHPALTRSRRHSGTSRRDGRRPGMTASAARMARNRAAAALVAGRGAMPA